MTGPMNDNIFSGEAVSVPPFVEEDQNDDASTDTVEIVSPDSEEGAAALEDDFDETMSDKIDILINKIDDLITVGKIDKLIDSLNEAFDDSMPEEDSADFGGGADIMPPDMEDVMNEAMPVGEDSDEGAGDSEESSDDNTEKEAAMATIKKRAADDQIKDTQTADEVLDKVVDQGTMFDQAQDESHDESTVPDSANVGDNYAGNTDTVSDTDDLKPVTTSAAMRLADAYIKAGVLKEADRYNAIDRIASTMTRTAARNQLTALELVRKASKRKATKRIAFDTDLGSGLVLDDKSDGISPVDIIFRKSDERDDDVYGPYVVIDEEGYTIGDVLRTPVKFVNTGYTATYFSNPRGEGIYGGNIDLSEKDDQATFETKEEAIEWAKGKLLNTSRYASKKRKASKRKAVTVRKAEDGSFTITTDPGFSATMTQTDDGVDGVVNGEEQHFNTMDEAMQYISDNSGLDMNADAPVDVEAAKKAAARKAAIRKAARKIAARRAAARKAAAKRAEKKPVHRMTAAQRKELAARIAKAKRAAKISSNDNKSMREAALAAARKKVARNPRLASASTAASADASLSLI